MNFEEIIPDFEALKQEILDFKRQMTVDDFYFYEWQRAGKFEEGLDALCNKHFGTRWESLESIFPEWYSDASADRKTKLKNSIHALNTYFFGKELSYDKKYDVEYEDDPDEEPDWRGATVGRAREIWNGEYEVRAKYQEGQECFKTAIEITKPEKQNILPKNWRTALTTLIDQPWRAFSGRFDTDGRIRGFSEYDAPKKLSTTDYTCFLALKNALRSDLSITTYEQEILMPVSSGIAAKIAIRKTGKYVLEMTNSEQQIYSMTSFSYDEKKEYDFEDKTVLHISGYTNSSVNVHIPNGYYFVDGQYVVQLEFIAAPILLNNMLMPIMSAVDHSSVDLLDDEEEERKQQKEDNY